MSAAVVRRARQAKGAPSEQPPADPSSITAPAEDYLKAIYDIERGGEAAATNDIAARLHYEVDDIIAARDKLKSQGARVLGDGTPKIGAHGKPVLFLHPKDFCGTLVELEQA